MTQSTQPSGPTTLPLVRCGVDLVDVARIERAIERHGERFYSRFFTAAERAHCANQPHRLAARIAAKEAVAKVFGTGIGDVQWVDIEILADERQRPVLHLHGSAQQLATQLGLHQWDVSLSHTHTQAMAMAVALMHGSAQ